MPSVRIEAPRREAVRGGAHLFLAARDAGTHRATQRVARALLGTSLLAYILSINRICIVERFFT